jgi:hypothetical protein
MADRYDFIVDQGTDFSVGLDLLDANQEPLDMTGVTARGQARKYYGSNTAISFNTSIADGFLIIDLTAEQTANMTAMRYVYDVELVLSDNTVVRIIEGNLDVAPEVTR